MTERLSDGKLPVVILCGGKGTRLKEKTEDIPKPLIEIGIKPILWHIMKIYHHHKFNNFVLCLGYMGIKIKEFFIKKQEWEENDFILDINNNSKKIECYYQHNVNWTIKFSDTGEDTNTGGRVKKIEKYIDNDNFFLTYGDGLANININELLDYHIKKGKILTITCVRPRSQFGILKINSENFIEAIQEKPVMTDWVNGGFFVCNKKIFDYLDDNCILEREPMETLVKEGQVAAYKHEGFWQCMDTYKDKQLLDGLWNSDNPPWKLWK